MIYFLVYFLEQIKNKTKNLTTTPQQQQMQELEEKRPFLEMFPNEIFVMFFEHFERLEDCAKFAITCKQLACLFKFAVVPRLSQLATGHPKFYIDPAILYKNEVQIKDNKRDFRKCVRVKDFFKMITQ